jgi:hypothetical protein
MEEQHHGFIRVGTVAKEPPREVEPPKTVVMEDHAGGYPVPVDMHDQGVVHLLLEPVGRIREAEMMLAHSLPVVSMSSAIMVSLIGIPFLVSSTETWAARMILSMCSMTGSMPE